MKEPRYFLPAAFKRDAWTLLAKVYLDLCQRMAEWEAYADYCHADRTCSLWEAMGQDQRALWACQQATLSAIEQLLKLQLDFVTPEDVRQARLQVIYSDDQLYLVPADDVACDETEEEAGEP